MPRRYVPKGVTTGQGRPKKPRNPGGRPTKYHPSFEKIGKDLAQLGLCDYEIAEKLGIAVPTFYDWFRVFPDFSKSIKEGRAQSMTGLSFKAILKALEGGQKKKTKTIRVKDADGNITEIREEELIEEIWPCKESAFRHLTATVPEYAGLKETMDKSPLIEALSNIDKIAETLKQDSYATDEKATSLNS